MYWPLEEMEPAPVLESPPLTDQETEGVPLLLDAMNCSTTPEEVEALQPVQVVSMAAVPGETVSDPPEAPADEPPQPASRKAAGTMAAAMRRPIRRAVECGWDCGAAGRDAGRRRTDPIAVFRVVFSEAMRGVFPVILNLDRLLSCR